MFPRWHKSWLLALWVSACALNPQPDLPSASPSGSGGGIDVVDAGGSPPTTGGNAGGGLALDPGAEAGARSEGGSSGEAGALGIAGSSGAGEGGLAGEGTER